MTVHLRYPFGEAAVRALRAGDSATVTGRIHTGRDRFHGFLASGGECPVDLRDGAIYHCGPVVTRGADGAWRVVAAGPTTSGRENPYMPDVIRRFGPRVIIGKGGMDAATAAACRECGCVYMQAVGGAAAKLASCVKRVVSVHFLEEFGATEACWVLDVADLPVVVGIDARGESLYESVKSRAGEKLARLLRA